MQRFLATTQADASFYAMECLERCPRKFSRNLCAIFFSRHATKSPAKVNEIMKTSSEIAQQIKKCDPKALVQLVEYLKKRTPRLAGRNLMGFEAKHLREIHFVLRVVAEQPTQVYARLTQAFW